MMSPSLQNLVAFVIARISAILLVPAIGSGVWTYYAYEQMIEPLGWGLRGRFIAALGAVMASTLYYVGGYALITLLPRYALRARVLSAPMIVLYAAMVIATSSAPQVILFHAPAREAEIRQFLEQTARFVDGVKLAVLQASQMAPALNDMASKVDALATLDEKGVISGITSAGVVVSTTRAKAEELRKAKATIVGKMKEVEPQLTKIDTAFASVREAAKNAKLDFEERRLAVEQRLDEIRTAAIALSSTFPVVSLQTLASSLQSDLIKPVATAKGGNASRQASALAEIEGALRDLGKDLRTRADDIARKLNVAPPIYQPEPASKLIFTQAGTLVQAWSLSLGIDLFSLVLLALACIGEDEARRQARFPEHRPEWLIEAERALEATRHLEANWTRSRDHLGAVPYPAATQARLNGKRIGRTETQEER